ncbi:MAG: glycosyltransferase family 39 protein [Anaerolineae bacterium]
MPSRPYAALALALAALALRLPGLFSQPVVLTEGTTTITIARNLLAGRGFVGILGTVEPFVPPLYPLLIASLTPLSGDAILSARLISLLAGVALVPATYLLASTLFDRRTGFAAGLLVAGAPLLIEYSSLEWSETLYALLLVLGLAYLTRVEGALALALVVAWIILRRVAAPGQLGHAGRALMPLLAAFALVAAPYVLWLSLTLDRVTLETKSTLNFVIAGRMAQGESYVDAAYGLDADGRPHGVFLQRTAALSQAQPPDLPPPWSGSRLRQLWDGLRGVRQEMQLYLVSWLFLVAVAAGILRTLMTRASRPATLYLGSFIGLALLTVALVPQVYTRYLFPLFPLLCVWAGVGVGVGARGLRPHAPTVTVIIVCVLLLSLPRGSTVSSRRAVDVDQQRAGVWLAQQAPQGGLRILSVHSQVPFYAGAVHVPMPNGSPAQVLTYADAVQADVLITSPRKLASRPALQAWREGATLPAPWQAVYRDAEAADGELIVWMKTSK